MRKRHTNKSHIMAVRVRLARSMLRTQRTWQVSGNIFRKVIGVTGAEWQLMKRGAPIPERRDTLLSVREVGRIHRALEALFGGNHHQIARWLSSANTGAPFGGKAAKQALSDGLQKLREMRMYLEYHANGGW